MKSLYGKFLLFTVIIMLSSFLVAFLVVNTFYHQQLRGQNDEKNMKIAEEMAHYIESDPNIDIKEYLSTQANVGYKIYMTNETREDTYFGDAFREKNLTDEAIEQVLANERYHGMRDLPKETFVTGFFSDEMANTVGVPFTYNGQQHGLFIRPNIKLLFTEIHYLLGGLFIVMALFSLVAMLFVARKLIQPITTLTTATKKIGAENFALSLPINRADEIGQLADSFQTMANHLQESDATRKQFINDVSHDFQTPLQNIKGYAALLDDETITSKEHKKYTNIIESETERLSALTKQLLLLTSLDSLTTTMQQQTFSLDAQLKNVIQKYRWLMDEKNISLSLEIDEVSFTGQEEYTEKIWENLLSNALKYTDENGIIHVSLEKNVHEVIIIFSDTGIGISEKHIPQLFDRFFRVDEARHSKVEGTGLGLSIVEQAVELHNGTIDIQSELSKGTTFTIILPKK